MTGRRSIVTTSTPLPARDAPRHRLDVGTTPPLANYRASIPMLPYEWLDRPWNGLLRRPGVSWFDRGGALRGTGIVQVRAGPARWYNLALPYDGRRRHEAPLHPFAVAGSYMALSTVRGPRGSAIQVMHRRPTRTSWFVSRCSTHHGDAMIPISGSRFALRYTHCPLPYGYAGDRGRTRPVRPRGRDRRRQDRTDVAARCVRRVC